MTKFVSKSAFTIGLLVLLMAVPAFGASVNKSIAIGDGEESDGATSVNGSISVGDNAVVTGGLNTVNGSIRVGDGADIESARTVNGRLRMGEGVQAGNLTTVNGSITIEKSGTVEGDVTAVNGGVTVERDSRVSGAVSNVNGRIELTGAEIGGDVKTETGDVGIEETVIKGDLVIEKPNAWKRATSRKPKIVIGPGSRIEGAIIVEHEVELFISDSAEVGEVRGVMTMADAERFSGDRP